MRPRVRNQLILSFVFILFASVAICFYTYFMQEKFLFQYYHFNQKYNFSIPFEEKEFETSEQSLINGLLFKNKHSEGLVIINRENSGELQNFNPEKNIYYSELNFDIYIYDYRGNGKSKGNSDDMNSLIQDLDYMYKYFKGVYEEKNIILLGKTFGTGIAAKVASDNNPKCLILESPYYEFNEYLKSRSGWMPIKLINKYNFKTGEYLKTISCPVILINGDNDKKNSLIASERLQKDITSKCYHFIIKSKSMSEDTLRKLKLAINSN